MGFLKSLFCNHVWKKIGESSIEEDIASWDSVYSKYVPIKIILVSCSKCGKIKKIKMR